MSDPEYQALTVVLTRNHSEEEMQKVVEAITMVKGVLDVTPDTVDHITQHTQRLRVSTEIQTKVYRALQPVFKEYDPF